MMAARPKLCRTFQAIRLHVQPGSSPSKRVAAPFTTTYRAFHRSRPRCCDSLQEALETNKKWADATAKSDPNFFPTLAKGQAPSILWLGCSDSRVPETTILGLKPGQVFTHRNIANILNPTDVSMLSVVGYAVTHVKVQHVVVCGHSSCGGVAASLANAKLDVLDVWLQPLRALREEYADELETLDTKAQADLLARANVRHGVGVLKRIPAVIDAQKERGLKIHGLLYNLENGVLEDVAADEAEAHGTKRVAAFHRQ